MSTAPTRVSKPRTDRGDGAWSAHAAAWEEATWPWGAVLVWGRGRDG